MFQLSAEQIDIIDLMMEADGIAPVEGVSPPWYGGAAMSNEVSEELKELGVVGIALLPPINPRRRYEKSQWVLVKDPTDDTRFRFVSELHLRAAAKFGELEPQHTVARLSNGNIELFTRVGLSTVTESKYGVPAGTSEYAKRWRAANKDKVKKNNQKTNERRKSALKLLKERQETVDTGKQQELDAMAEKLGVDPASLK